MNKTRDEELKTIKLLFGTLSSAASTVSIGEDINGCERPVAEAKAMALKQIERIREHLTNLEETFQ